MESPRPVPAPPSATGGVREARRLETRARLFDAALAEISQHGLAAADVSAIAAAAGVVRGTFYFHFPTKEHVLAEVERNEELRIVSELGEATGDLTSILSQLIDQVRSAEPRLGAAVFRGMLGLHFSSTGHTTDDMTQHPLGDFLVELIARAQDSGQVSPDLDAAELGAFFLTGLFALLATGAHEPGLLNRYVSTIVKGMEIR